jgi:hypothetical protein
MARRIAVIAVQFDKKTFLNAAAASSCLAFSRAMTRTLRITEHKFSRAVAKTGHCRSTAKSLYRVCGAEP